MKKYNYSLYSALVVIIFLAVSLTTTINSFISYQDIKDRTIEYNKKSSKQTMLSIKDNIQSLIEAYAVNEYENILTNEINRKDFNAIIVEDYNMGKILGKEKFITGKIKKDEKIIEYLPNDKVQNDYLSQSFYKEESQLISKDNTKLGKITIYISDEKLHKELNDIIFNNLKTTVLLSLFLIILLFIAIRKIILRPISDIIDTISHSDEDGIPLKPVPNYPLNEIDNLVYNINKMISSIKGSRTILKEEQNKLYEALQLQTTIFDNSGYLIIRTDTNGLIKQINKEAELLLGYNANELINKSTPEKFHLQEEILDKKHNLEKIIKKEISGFFEIFILKAKEQLHRDHEWTYVSKDGNHIPVSLSVSTLKNKDGEIFGYICIAKDITQNKIIESQSKLASMGEMIGNIAHQWRQPLSAISSIASAIKLKSEINLIVNNELSEDMDSITEQVTYLSKTIDDFREFIKDKDRQEEILLAETIKKTLSILKSTLTKHSIKVHLDLNEDIKILAYENQLIQAFINIINNAKDAMTEKINQRDERLLFISIENKKKKLVLTIKDNAGGIRSDILDKIFEPYFTTKHQSVGTGIGLSMTYQIITDYHDATINASNITYTYNDKKYTGAKFKISFNKEENS